MDPTPLEPPSLVEAGLGPSRGDRARPEIEHGALRRRPTGRKLEQHPLAQLDAVEAAHVCRHPNGVRRDARSAGDDDLRSGRVADPRREVAAVELVQAQAAPPEPEPAEGDRRQGEPELRWQAERRARPPATLAAMPASRGNAIQFAAASPSPTAASAIAGQPRSSVSCSRLTASPGRAAAPRAPARCRGSHRGRRRSASGPWVWRQSRIFCAVTGPIPGKASSCSSVALARLTFAALPVAAPPPPAPGSAARRDDDLLPVGDRRRQIDEREVGPPARTTRADERIGDAGSLGEAHEPRVPDSADDVDDEPRPGTTGTTAPPAALFSVRATACAAGARAAPWAAIRLPTRASTAMQTTSRMAVCRRGNRSKIMSSIVATDV